MSVRPSLKWLPVHATINTFAHAIASHTGVEDARIARRMKGSDA